MNRFTCIVILLGFISCNHLKKDNSEVTYYEHTNNPKEERLFENQKDTTSYLFISYYLNGQVESKGEVINSKKAGTWKEWYADGRLRREAEYVNGEADLFNEKRQIPLLIFSSDSLIVGVQTFVKFIHSYPSDGLACSNGMIMGLEDKSSYDFVITPFDADSMRFYYDCVWCQPEKTDTILLMVSEIKNLSEYGLTEDDIRGQSSISIISNNVESIVLATLPIHKKR
ncbi:hypothetical protein FACS189437_07870 [Bacteroidia bacterium]|nr:hypothetical protein FACS189437_07870 [Bacteroidia bacterium]